MTVDIYSWEEVSTLFLNANLADMAGLNSVVVDLGSPLTADAAGYADWLSRQPVPVVGMGESNAPYADLVDILVDDDSLPVVLDGVSRNPLAAAVLVQVLRTTVALPVDQALSVESLAYATLQGGVEFQNWLEVQPERESKVTDVKDLVLVERKGASLRLTLNSPQNRNALSAPLRDALTEACRLAQIDHSIESVDVFGAGPSFCAGGDLSEFGQSRDTAVAHQSRMLRMPALSLAARSEIYTMHLHGACVGAGIEMPAFAGRVLAHPETTFRLPEIGMGLIPGAGGCVSIPRRIGRQRTAYLAITGETLAAEQALEWGLIDAIES